MHSPVPAGGLKEALTVTIDGFSIADAGELSIQDCLGWATELSKKIENPTEAAIGHQS